MLDRMTRCASSGLIYASGLEHKARYGWRSAIDDGSANLLSNTLTNLVSLIEFARAIPFGWEPTRSAAGALGAEVGTVECSDVVPPTVLLVVFPVVAGATRLDHKRTSPKTPPTFSENFVRGLVRCFEAWATGGPEKI